MTARVRILRVTPKGALRMQCLFAALGLLLTMAVPAGAQGVTGGLAGTVKDAQGGVIPGATVSLISEGRGTKVAPIVTNANGDFRFPNLTADTYTIQVEMPSFKTLKRSGVTVSPGPAVVVGTLTIEIGGATETVTVKGEAPLIQAQSGERSFTVTSEQMADLPINGRDYATLLQLTPGVRVSTGLGSLSVIGGSGGTNYMMDGLTNMDPGVNREAQKVSIEAISEVKVLTSSYQAEYGRSSGLQVNAVTKSGTNRFRGSVYDVEQNSKWNANNKANILNGDPKTVTNQRDWGGAIGGPVGKPGGSNKLFFYWNQEYNPRTRGGSVVSYRMPTELERKGDFSQTLDSQGNLYNLIKDPQSTSPCTAANTAGCFADGGVLGRIPQNRLYQTGLNILNWWPKPNLPSTPGVAYNYQRTADNLSLYGYQPIIRLDYQARENLRGSFKFAEYQQPNGAIRGTIPGFNDTKEDNFGIWTESYVGNWTVNQSTFLEASYGRNTHHQEGCSITGGAPNFCTGALAANPTSNRLNVGMGDLPLLFPDAGVMDPRYKSYTILNNLKPPFWDGTRVTPVPSFTWGGRVANSPPSIGWPNFILDTVANTFNLSVTKVAGPHTLKSGYAFLESVQRRGNANIQGTYNFTNDNNNPLDTTFPFANAAVGVFSSIAQTSRWTEGRYTLLNNEAYIQDNWKLKRGLTLDYGMRFIGQQPGYDALLAGDNFLPETFAGSQAPAIYVYGCVNGVYPCSGTNRVAMNPVTRQFIGTSGQASVIVGTLVPNTGNLANGLKRPGKDIASTFYRWPKVVLAPRWGAAWDVRGSQHFVVRGGGGMFYDRPSASNIYTTVNNPPSAQAITVRYGQLQDLSKAGLSTKAPPTIRAFHYNTNGVEPMPTSVQWNGGVQMVLPWSMALDVSYTGQHAYNTESTQDINNIDLGMAYVPQLQDPTLTSTGVTTSLVNTNVAQARFYQGYGGITMVEYRGWETYHSIQISLTRRLKNGVSLGFNDTVGLYDWSDVTLRLQHNANGTVTVRDDQATAQALLGNQYPARHQMKGYFTWVLPKLRNGNVALKAAGLVINDWQLSGVWSGITSTPYPVNFSYQSGGGNLALTGSPDYAARVRVVGDPGAGCSQNTYKQFNTSAFQGPLPGSVGLESGAGYLRGCFQSSMDLSINRNVRLGRGRTVQLRVDMFNAFNQAGITGRNTSMTLTSPADPLTVLNLPYDAAGNLIPTLSKPRGAGFGVVTGYQAPRVLQFQARFAF